MKPSSKYTINVLTTGLLVLLLMSIVLCWARKICHVIAYAGLIDGRTGLVSIQPSTLVPHLDSDPNVIRQSSIQACIADDTVLYGFGLVQELFPGSTLSLASVIFYPVHERRRGGFLPAEPLSLVPDTDLWRLIYFDEELRLFVYCDVSRNADAGEKNWTKKINFYVGPEGFAENLAKPVGRFTDPVISRSRDGFGLTPGPLTIFDEKLARFFAIEFERQTITKGPKLPKDYHPVQINGLVKNFGVLGPVRWRCPYRKATQQEIEEWVEQASKRGQQIRISEHKLVPMGKNVGVYPPAEKHILVLDESGRVELLDTETLELTGNAGHLPIPPPYKQDQELILDDLFAYQVLPFTIDGRHAGTICGSVSKEALGIRILVFDPNGQLLEDQRSLAKPENQPGGPLLLTITYILENLQPPLFGLISYLTASSFEATGGHRALLILPNSLVAMFARNPHEQSIRLRFCFAMLIISPSIVLGLFLAWRVTRDAKTIGLSKDARRYWAIATTAFGLTAYFTYRLTRPEITLVTCMNCGSLRRPDMHTCHRCNSKWLVPELTAPPWRILDDQPRDDQPARTIDN